MKKPRRLHLAKETITLLSITAASNDELMSGNPDLPCAPATGYYECPKDNNETQRPMKPPQ